MKQKSLEEITTNPLFGDEITIKNGMIAADVEQLEIPVPRQS